MGGWRKDGARLRAKGGREDFFLVKQWAGQRINVNERVLDSPADLAGDIEVLHGR